MPIYFFNEKYYLCFYKNSEWGWKEATLIKIMSVVL